MEHETPEDRLIRAKPIGTGGKAQLIVVGAATGDVHDIEVVDLSRWRDRTGYAHRLVADHVIACSVEEVERELLRIAVERCSVKPQPKPPRITFTDAVDAWLRSEATAVVPTGFGWFDGPTEGGLPVGGITALIAYPGVGKSALALQLSLAALLRDSTLRAVWGLGEMMPGDLARRAACVGSMMLDGTDAVSMSVAGARGAAARAVNVELCNQLGDRLTIVPTPLTVTAMEEAVVETSARLLVVDYVQLIRPEEKTSDRVAELDGIIGRVRELAIAHECAVIGISSMAKSSSTASRIGQLARGTGEIEYAAALVYAGEAEERDGEPAIRDDGTLNVAWRCRKARNAAKQDLLLEFNCKTQTFGVRGFDEFSSHALR